MDQNINTEVPTPAVEEKSPTGAIISIVVIVLVLAFGAYYFLRQVPAAPGGQVLSPSELTADQTISDLSAQGTSTELSDIQKDLDATDFSNIEVGLSDISI